ncbi:MAG: tetratricopeptide repeat protein [Bacteroidaceae bacterium]|nr:tetratricopeptide repeat protein [Bacteroidaceae bacterium]
MRTVYKIFLLLVFSFSFLVSFAASKVEADALYEKEQYHDAAAAYEAVLKSEGMAAEVYYNLGNCYYKLDEIPLAVLNYERAFLLDPGDADIRANLALARGKTVDKVVPPSEMFFVTWWRDLTNCMSMNTWAVVGIVSFVLMLLGVLIYIFVHQLVARKIGFYGAIVMLVIALIANLAALSQHLSQTHRDTAIILVPAVTVKSSPSETSTDLFLIHEGSKVEILDGSMKEWMEVKFEEGKQGWIPVSTLEVI